jgi:8-oxo-dGTP pyrophosphatase MutT (NUDIX family)
MQDAGPVIERHAARVLLLDARDRLLLFRCEEPGAGRAFWITPGGGLEPGETHEQAALRELREEAGLVVPDIGPCVWTRTHTFPWLGRVFRQHERFHLLRCQAHQVSVEAHTEEEQRVLTEHRWWSAEAIREASATAFAPRGLADWLGRLLADGPPEAPIDVGA